MQAASQTRMPARSFLAYLAPSDLRAAVCLCRKFPLSRLRARTFGGALFVRRLYRLVECFGRKQEPRPAGRIAARRRFDAYRFKSARRILHDGDLSGGLERPEFGERHRL